MEDSSEELTQKQEAAIVALITHGTVREAARACSIGETTLFRWLQQPAFAARYRAARRQVVEAAIGRLQRLAVRAVDTLERNLNCENPTAEIRSAQLILGQGVKGVELMDTQERLERLEALLDEREEKNKELREARQDT
ncbi:MAG: hypothetical protein AUG51_07775 [Acidobacteria bacterium 13_1_20CM_3_53_8]|nr:MAG: hypothetical protein AUG51_07775 [Acidobacteria bacterium 13_1_20CM_3_53_8]